FLFLASHHGILVYLTHQQKVLQLSKSVPCHFKSWCIHRDKYWSFAYVMRTWFEEHKNERDLVKATQLLKEPEEEFWRSASMAVCLP
uniref:NADH dehydrogenase [ubiquinone] 1 beta subcomplex subunit 9 n=1 Tax=Equus asinus asinus TaxID=83772 RepID=A0A8C4PTI2_EQUAS